MEKSIKYQPKSGQVIIEPIKEVQRVISITQNREALWGKVVAGEEFLGEEVLYSTFYVISELENGKLHQVHVDNIMATR